MATHISAGHRRLIDGLEILGQLIHPEKSGRFLRRRRND
jgi:hypothetical protein